MSMEKIEMKARRLHPFEYQSYRQFVNGRDKRIDVIFEQPTVHVILAAFDNEEMVGACHIDLVDGIAESFDSDKFQNSGVMIDNWCNHHNRLDILEKSTVSQ